MSSFYVRNEKTLGFMALEGIHSIFFHFIETVKVRGMSRNLKSGDISHYFKNNVEQKPLISGVVSGFLGAMAGSITFMTSFNLLTKYFYRSPKFNNWDFRAKNLLIYSLSDFSASFSRIFFETRK